MLTMLSRAVPDTAAIDNCKHIEYCMGELENDIEKI